MEWVSSCTISTLIHCHWSCNRSVLCADIDDEPRFMGTIAGWIAEGSVPPYHAFTHKTERKKRKRQKAYEKDREEFKKDNKDEQGVMYQSI